MRRLTGLSTEELNRDPAARERLLGSADSLGGARPKASLRDECGNLMIAKFTSDDDTMTIERAEVATLRLARTIGINAASARIERGGTDSPIALIDRFDRVAGERVHYLSAQSFVGAESATDDPVMATAPSRPAPCHVDPGARRTAACSSGHYLSTVVG